MIMKPEQMYEFVKPDISKKKLSLAMKAGIALGIGLAALLSALLAVQYFYDIYRFKNIDPTEAQKIGNWELPDKDYGATDFGEIAIDGRDIARAEVRDKKNGNRFVFFKTDFSAEGFLRSKEALLEKILENYNLGGFYIISTDKFQKYGEEINYSVVGWGADRSAKKGAIASIDCRTKTGNIDTVFAVAVNSLSKYDGNRALEFIKTLKCDSDDKGISRDDERNLDKLDSDKDGLTDKVEKMLKTDPYKADTDGDGYNDFDEIKNGYNPMALRPWDKYTDQEFAKVKKDIKYASEDVYRALFREN
jgi:hypothetical protein